MNSEHDTALLGGTRTAGLIPDAEHRILPRTGHCCFLEDPGGFEVIVREFLQRNDLWPPPNALDSTPAHNQSSETASTGL